MPARDFAKRTADCDLGRFFRRCAARCACDHVRRETLGGPLVAACAATEWDDYLCRRLWFDTSRTAARNTAVRARYWRAPRTVGRHPAPYKARTLPTWRRARYINRRAALLP